MKDCIFKIIYQLIYFWRTRHKYACKRCQYYNDDETLVNHPCRCNCKVNKGGDVRTCGIPTCFVKRTK